MRTWALVPARYSGHYGEPGLFDYFPFFTNMFLHGSTAHLIGNMWTLYIFGDNVEDRMGKWRYLLFYILCGVAASYTHYLLNSGSQIPALGASGAISGVMGAYMLMFPQSRIIFLIPIFFLPYFFEMSAFIYLAFWFAAQLLSGTASLFANPNGPGIAFWAHVGGFAAGVLFFKLFDRGPSTIGRSGFSKDRHRYMDYYSNY